MCFKCDKKGQIAKDCKGKQIMKKRQVQEKSDNEDNKKEEQSFSKNLKCYSVRMWTDFRFRNRTVVIISLQWMEST